MSHTIRKNSKGRRILHLCAKILTICICNHICQVKFLPGMRKGLLVTTATTKALCINTGGVEVHHTYLEVHVLAALSFG